MTYDRNERRTIKCLAIIFGGLLAVALISYSMMPTKHRYSDVPGQDHPYCPPDPRECG